MLDTENQRNRNELLIKLLELARKVNFDPERDHKTADSLLLEYINDTEITSAFDEIEKWYA